MSKLHKTMTRMIDKKTKIYYYEFNIIRRNDKNCKPQVMDMHGYPFFIECILNYNE